MKKKTTEKKLYTRAALIERTGMTRDQAKNWISHGRITGVMIGNRQYYTEDDIERAQRFFDNHKAKRTRREKIKAEPVLPFEPDKKDAKEVERNYKKIIGEPIMNVQAIRRGDSLVFISYYADELRKALSLDELISLRDNVTHSIADVLFNDDNYKKYLNSLKEKNENN